MSHSEMGHGEGGNSPNSKAKAKDCAFQGMNTLATGATNPVILGLALVFAMLLGLAPRQPIRLPTPANLRPPLRGPPSYA